MTPPTLQEVDDARRNDSGAGAGVKVAILDTGIDQSHPSFAQARFAQAVCGRVDSAGFSLTTCGPEDLYGHGTAVAGIIHSLAPMADLLSVRVLDCGKRQHRHELIKLGALHALEAGAHILNCSFGMPGVPFSLPLYKSWTDRAFELDRHVVAASSNANPDEPQWPAFFPHVLSVLPGPLDPDELYFKAGSMVPFQAAGVDIPVLAPGNQSATLTGSSFAAAHLTGILTRILSRFPNLSPSLAYDLLRRLAKVRTAGYGTETPIR